MSETPPRAAPAMDPRNSLHFEKARESLTTTKRESRLASRAASNESNPLSNSEQFDFGIELHASGEDDDDDSGGPRASYAPPTPGHDTIAETLNKLVWYMRLYGLEEFSPMERPLSSLWYVSIRLLVAVGLIVKVTLFFRSEPVMVVSCDTPMVLAYAAAGWAMIPAESKFRALRQDLVEGLSGKGGTAFSTRPRRLSAHGYSTAHFLRSGDVAHAARDSLAFVALWLIVALVSSTFLAFAAQEKEEKKEEARNPGVLFAQYFVLSSATTPALGSALFALGVDVRRVRNDLAYAAKGLLDQSLTPARYEEARDRTLAVKRTWNYNLTVLFAVALYNALGIIVIAPMNNGMQMEVEMDVLMIVAMGKEMVLLFCILLLVMTVNDDADELATALCSTTWGSFDSEAEWRRNRLFALATYTGPKPGSHRSLLAFLKASRFRPVSFTVGGFRPTMKWVLGIVVSLLISAAVSFSKRYAESIWASPRDDDMSMGRMDDDAPRGRF